ncbi:TonB family protein [Ekhidna sp.]|uniref:energy transducer TonB n=1 Tax=Ekhidna sp. TaxID=2608089 RepID=UPI003296A410
MISLKPSFFLLLFLTLFDLFAQDTLYYSSFNSEITFDENKLIYELKSNKDTVYRYFLSNDQAAIKGPIRDGELHGKVEKYYPNGQLYEVVAYDQGQQIGSIDRWYANGSPMGTFKKIPIDEQEAYELTVSERVITFYDSTGNQTVISGHGSVYRIYPLNDNFEFGQVANGLKTGEWKGLTNQISYSETYEDGKLINGTSIKDGNKSIYNELKEDPSYKGGIYTFYRFLADNLRYPNEAKKRGIKGYVYLSFIIEKDGKMTNLRVTEGIGYGCDKESLRVMKKTNKWIPGKTRGQMVRKEMKQRIQFDF